VTYPSCEVRCARDVEPLLRQESCGEPACFIAETIQGVGGAVTPPPEYFPIVYDIIHRFGGLCIADEVQTGFGRTGARFWGFENRGVKPDLVTLAKGIGNGGPLAACVTRPEIAKTMTAEAAAELAAAKKAFEAWLNSPPEGLTAKLVARLRGSVGVLGHRQPIDVLRE
jgi:4-aminobutyrate aminotransferase-like enzyme